MKSKYQKRKKKSSLKIIIFGGLFFCLLGVLIYFLVWSSFFWVEISLASQDEFVSDSIEIAEYNLNQKFWKVIPKKSIFLVPVDRIREDILDRFPEIEQVEVSKKMPRILEIKLLKRERIGIWCQIEWQVLNKERKINQCFQIDQHGIIFKESSLISGSMILNIYSQIKSVQIRDEVIPPAIVDFIIKVKTAPGLPLEIVDFEFVSIEDLKAKTSVGWYIYFNPAYSVDSQIRALEIVLESEIQDSNSLEYIDLRIENRIYYK